MNNYKWFKFLVMSKKDRESLLPSEKIRYWKVLYIFTSTSLLAMLIIIAIVVISSSIFINLPRPIYEEDISMKVSYLSNFSHRERLVIDDSLSRLNRNMKLAVKIIYFTKDKDYIERVCMNKNAEGCNSNDNIYIYVYTENIFNLKDTICHEILHSIIRDNENNHRIIYFLGQNEVCYE